MINPQQRFTTVDHFIAFLVHQMTNRHLVLVEDTCESGCIPGKSGEYFFITMNEYRTLGMETRDRLCEEYGMGFHVASEFDPTVQAKEDITPWYEYYQNQDCLRILIDSL